MLSFSLFSSKDGGAKVMLRICARPKPSEQDEGTNPTEATPDENFNFTFISVKDSTSDREVFKREISKIIAQNRLLKEQQLLKNQNNHDQTNTLSQNGEGSSSKNGVGTSDDKQQQSKTMDPLQDWKLKKRVLQNNPNLRQLHKTLVIGGQISEIEFWQGREDLLYDEARLESQARGRSSQMVDPRPETTDGGEITISITPQMIREIFEQFPVLQKAYNENVPPLTDQNFWTRYFRSKLFHRHRSTVRQASDSVKDDEIFDKYLGDDDDGIEPKNINFTEVYKLLDLAATQEDHIETGNSQDWTMRAGSQKSSLPLMRRFNEHSQRLLDSSLGKKPERISQGIITDGSAEVDVTGNSKRKNYYDEIDLEDLNARSNPERISLNIKSHESYFEVNDDENNQNGGSTRPGNNNGNLMKRRKRTAEEEVECIRAFSKKWSEKKQDDDFDLNVSSSKGKGLSRDNRNGEENGRVGFEEDEIQSSNQFMFESIFTRYEQRQSFGDDSIPKNLLNQIVSIHSTTNEFLRQFWQSILPPPPSSSSSSITNKNQSFPDINNLLPEQRALKAQRMISFIEKTNERVSALIDQVKNDQIKNVNGVDLERLIYSVLESTIQAVEAAIKFYRDRVG